MRSAVEFLMQDYRHFPIEKDELLGERLDEFLELEPVNELTQVLEDWRNSPWDVNDFKGPIPEGVPKEHYWWHKDVRIGGH